MTDDPFSFKHELADFDMRQLPVDPALLQADPSILAASVQAYYEELLRKMGGTAAVAIIDDVVSVTWYPSSGDAVEMVSQHARKLLSRGDYQSAEPLLHMLQAKNPNDPDLLYNLGMMLSDQRKLDEAVPMLEKLVEIEPQSSNGWTALGVAYSRNREYETSEKALKRALEIDPDNAYALRNLGALQQQTAPELALAGLEKAARLMPDDQQTQYAYAQCLIDLGQNEEADPILQRVIAMDSLSDIAELARSARRKMAHETMRDEVGGGLRMDAVFFCLDAMKKFRELGDAKTRAVVYEIAVMGRSGLDIHDPATKYTIKSLPGRFSGMHLVCLMYTGSRMIEPDLDCGIDFSKEYAEAEKLFKVM
jgi:tetratricopeptide (TPR) repeat protein